MSRLPVGAASLLVLLLPLGAQAGVKITLTPSQSTVAVTQTQDFTAVITSTTTKNVKLLVCDSNGANCLAGGHPTRGTIAEIGRDANNNPIVRYTAPATLPPSALCAPRPPRLPAQVAGQAQEAAEKGLRHSDPDRPGRHWHAHGRRQRQQPRPGA